MFERFTDRTRRVLVLAQEESRLLRHDRIGTEHLLLGLIHEGDGLAARTLDSLGISLLGARKEVATIVGLGDAEAERSGSPPFTQRAKKVLELSLPEAMQFGDRHIGTEHVLLGLVGAGEGHAFDVLAALGAPPVKVRERLVQLMSKARDPLAAVGGDGVRPAAAPSTATPSSLAASTPRL